VGDNSNTHQLAKFRDLGTVEMVHVLGGLKGGQGRNYVEISSLGGLPYCLHQIRADVNEMWKPGVDLNSFCWKSMFLELSLPSKYNTCKSIETSLVQGLA